MNNPLIADYVIQNRESHYRLAYSYVKNPDDALDVLSKVGSLDIAGMAGVYLACAARRVPVVTDGLISNVAALTAMRLKPEAVEYMIPSHISFEPGAKLLKEITGLEPMIDMDMRLGEGTGCAQIGRASCRERV